MTSTAPGSESCRGLFFGSWRVRYSDFFTLSECRDLLFHVHEHRHTLAQIADFLTENDLTFLGFDLPRTKFWFCPSAEPFWAPVEIEK